MKEAARVLVAAIRPHVTYCDEARRCLRYFWDQSKADVLSQVPRPGLVYFHRRGRSGM